MKLKVGVIVALHLRISHVLHEMAESVLSFSFVTFISPVQKLTSGDKQGAGHDVSNTLSSLRKNTKTSSTCLIDKELLAVFQSCRVNYYTGRFIMFSVITNIYNKKTKGPHSFISIQP